MGQKLDLSSNDSLLQIEDIQGEGLFVGCCCCGQQSIVYFDEIEDLALNKIEGKYFYIYVCEDCEKDVKFILENGVEKISYDLLWLLQRDLEEALLAIEGDIPILEEERNVILLNLYKEFETKLKYSKKEI